MVRGNTLKVNSFEKEHQYSRPLYARQSQPAPTLLCPQVCTSRAFLTIHPLSQVSSRSLWSRSQYAPFFGTASLARVRRSLMPTFVAADDVHRRSSVRLPGLEPMAWSRTNCSVQSRRFSTLLTLLSRASRSFSMSLVHKLLSPLMLASNQEGMFDRRSTCSK